ncbi:MAG: hypothetical protein HYR71_06770, partial [Chloroflexi bacterium]|nr:hypothetical protein [Chloroflexota bacterium]
MKNHLAVNEPTTAEYVVKNRLQAEDEALHGWYRFVLGYPPHLVREYLQKLEADPERDWVLDPFCGTATTPVEARLRGHAVVGIDANPIALLASRVKLNWAIDTDWVSRYLDDVSEAASALMQRAGLSAFAEPSRQLKLLEAVESHAYRVKGASATPDWLTPRLSESAEKLIPEGFISPKPLMSVLAIGSAIQRLVREAEQRDFLNLGLATTIVACAGNVGFGPEVYRLPPKEDVDVLGDFRARARRMVEEMRAIQQRGAAPPTIVLPDDARVMASLDRCPPVGVIITSPPYPNEKDYTRSTRLESVLLGLIGGKADLRAIKAHLLRSNTRTVFVEDDDDRYVVDIRSVTQVADEIEARRIALGKTSGFERLYHRVTRLYFGGMYRHFAALRPHLRAGARLAYVVGDQMSYFRVPIRTAQLLADVAVKAGY